MARLTDALLQGAYSTGSGPMVDPQYGGQLGWSPNLREVLNNQKYVSKNVNCLLLEAPTGFQMLPEPDRWVRTLKEMFEVHAKSITGLNSGLESSFAESDVGSGGEKQHALTNVMRTQTVPVFTWTDLYGRPFQNFLWEWTTMLGQDPDTTYPGVVTLGAKPTDMLNDISTATALFYETDPSNTSIAKAWVITNMFPKSTGEIKGQRDLSQAGEQSDLSIEFTGIAVSSLAIRSFAQSIHNKIIFDGANPNLRPSFVDGISADVLATARGFHGNVDDLTSTAITRA